MLYKVLVLQKSKHLVRKISILKPLNVKRSMTSKYFQRFNKIVYTYIISNSIIYILPFWFWLRYHPEMNRSIVSFYNNDSFCRLH